MKVEKYDLQGQNLRIQTVLPREGMPCLDMHPLPPPLISSHTFTLNNSVLFILFKGLAPSLLASLILWTKLLFIVIIVIKLI